MKELTKEQLKKEMIETKQKIQLDFILDLKDRVQHYAEKTIRTSYEPSEQERQEFNEIRKIINGIKEKHELNWFNYDESDDLEEAIKYNIAVNCEQRLNGYYDDCFTELYDKEDWYDYIFNLMQEEWHQNGFIFYDDRTIPKFTKTYGHDKVKALIKLWVDNYEDVKPYIKW